MHAFSEPVLNFQLAGGRAPKPCTVCGVGKGPCPPKKCKGSPSCSLKRGKTIYTGCGYAYQSKNNRNKQCGRGGTSKFIWDDVKKSACGIKRGQTVYTGCGYTYQTLRDRNRQCGRGGSLKFIPTE